MDNDLRNILSENNSEIDPKDLQAYLNNQLPENEHHELEKKMLDDPFVNDAVEGLQKIKSNKNIDQYVFQLNKELHQHLTSRKKRKKPSFLNPQIWSIIAIILILSLIILSYFLIKYLLHF